MTNRKIGLPASVFLTTLAAASTADASGRSLVGDWAPVRQPCSRHALTIAPLALREYELSCRFASVTRADDVVTFKGECTRAGDDLDNAGYFPATVVARLTGDTLNVVVNNGRMGEFDGHLGPFKRCGQRTKQESPTTPTTTEVALPVRRAPENAGDPIPIDRGVYVEDSWPCRAPPMVGITRYDGKGFSVGHDYCSVADVKKDGNSNAYEMSEVCTVIQASSEEQRRESVVVVDHRHFTEKYADASVHNYRWCAAKFDDLFSN